LGFRIDRRFPPCQYERQKNIGQWAIAGHGQPEPEQLTAAIYPMTKHPNTHSSRRSGAKTEGNPKPEY